MAITVGINCDGCDMHPIDGNRGHRFYDSRTKLNKTVDIWRFNTCYYVVVVSLELDNKDYWISIESLNFVFIV